MSSVPSRDTFGLMPQATDVLIYIVLIPFAAVLLYGIYWRLKIYGIRELSRDFLNNPSSWLKSMLRYAWGQRRVVRERSAGLMHVPLLYGTLVLFIGTSLVFLDYDILRPLGTRILVGDFYLLYEVVLDTFGLLFIWGLVMALNRRLLKKEGRLREKTEYYAAISSLIFVGVTGYVLEGLRIYIKPSEASGFSFIGDLFALIIKMNDLSVTDALILYRVLWWAHALVAFGLIAAIPYTNLLHVFTSPLNIAAAHFRPKCTASINTPFTLQELEGKPEEEVKLGIRRVSDMNWRQRLGVDACTDCGRCESVCPAFAAGTPLSPRMVVQKLREELWRTVKSGEERDFFESGILTFEEIWACTSCGACVEACPVLISPLEYIMEARRSLTLEGKLDKRMIETLTNIARSQNPYGLPQSGREELVKELKMLGVKTIDEKPDAEYVYWLGCMASYDARTRAVAKKVARLLLDAGVDFAILGSEELCSGDPARRLGEEGRYQELAYANIETFRQRRIKKIITHCPHCFNIFKNEYRELGFEAEVAHHSVILARLRAEGRISPKEPGVMTLHDSCYMSRMNDVVEEPRRALEGARFVEMRRVGKNSFCCGAGGGNYWYEIKRGKRESWIRLDEAIDTGADTLVVECPFCLAMFEDAVRARGLNEKIKIRDLSEVLDVVKGNKN